MKQAFIGLLLLSSCAVSAQEVTDRTDQFTGNRVVSYTADRGKSGLEKPVFTIKSVKTKDGKSFRIELIFASIFNRKLGTGWRYLNCHDIDWLVDGVPFPAPAAATHNGQVIRGGTIETLSQEINADWALKISSATTAKYRVCNDVFELSKTDLRAFGEIANRITR